MTKKQPITLLGKIEKFLAKNDVSATRFGREAANDPKLVFDLREGRELRRATTAKIEQRLKAGA